jgi:hypothetical protein
LETGESKRTRKNRSRGFVIRTAEVEKTSSGYSERRGERNLPSHDVVQDENFAERERELMHAALLLNFGRPSSRPVEDSGVMSAQVS